MIDTVAARLGPDASNPRLAAWLGRVRLFFLITVPFGIAKALLDEPLRSRPTEADETFWIVPDINFGPTSSATLP